MGGNALPVCAISMSSKQDDIDRYGEIWRMELQESRKTGPFSKRKISTDEDTSDSQDSDNIVTQPKKKSLKKKKQQSSSSESEDEDKQEADRRKAELQLVMMEEGDDEEKHFDMREVVRRQEQKTKKGNKRRMRKKLKDQKEEEAKEDNFKLDLKDDRFSEVFTSSKFAPDPNHPQYKNTDNMQKLMKEKRERRKMKTQVRKEKNVGGEQEKTDEAGKHATDNSNVKSGKTNDEKNEMKRKA